MRDDRGKGVGKLVEDSIKALNDDIRKKNQQKDDLERLIENLKKEHISLEAKVKSLRDIVKEAVEKELSARRKELEKLEVRAKEELERNTKARIDSEGKNAVLNAQIKATSVAEDNTKKAKADFDASKKETDILKDKLTRIYEAVKEII